jgi:uncharacterized protein (DUF2141 family)
MKQFILLTSAIFALATGAIAQNKLTVEVSGIDSPKGNLYVALFNSGETFLSSNTCTGRILKIESNTVRFDFDGLSNGEYAIAMFQDENENGLLDMGKWNIPLEKYGFSNNANPAKLKRQPNFDECKFSVNENTVVSISLESAVK